MAVLNTDFLLRDFQRYQDYKWFLNGLGTVGTEEELKDLLTIHKGILEKPIYRHFGTRLGAIVVHKELVSAVISGQLSQYTSVVYLILLARFEDGLQPAFAATVLHLISESLGVTKGYRSDLVEATLKKLAANFPRGRELGEFLKDRVSLNLLSPDTLVTLDSLSAGLYSTTAQYPHFLTPGEREFVVENFGSLYPKVGLGLLMGEPRSEALFRPVVDQLVKEKEYDFFFSKVAKFFYKWELKSFLDVFSRWAKEWSAVTSPIVEPQRVVTELVTSLEMSIQLELKAGDHQYENRIAVIGSRNRKIGLASLVLLRAIQKETDIDVETATSLGISFNLFLGEDQRAKYRFDGVDHLKNSIGSLDRVLTQIFEYLKSEDLVLSFFELRSTMMPDVEAIRSGLEKVIRLHPTVFFSSWLNSLYLTNYNAKQTRMNTDIKNNAIETNKIGLRSAIDLVVDWNAVLPSLTKAQLLAILLIDLPGGGFSRAAPGFSNGIVKEFLRRYANKALTLEELVAIQSKMINYFDDSSSPMLEELILTTLRDLDFSNDDLTDLFITAIQPSAFQSTETFVSVVIPLVIRYFGLDRSGYQVSQESINEVTAFLKKAFPSIDPLLLQTILQKLAANLKAPRSLKSIFQLPMPTVNEGQGLVKLVHIWSQVFAKIWIDKQFELLQFLRGRTTRLPFDLRKRLREAFRAREIYLELDEVDTYIQKRITDLTPSARVGLFHMALSQPKGVLTDRELRHAMYKEILESFKDSESRAIFLDLWESGIAALPESLQKLVLSTVFSESGKSGSAEQALVTVISNMGPLFQKIGQSLPFEPSLRQSFRTELEKLWDEVQKLEWWEAWDLIHYQHGDLEGVGYVLSRILNSGTTEAALEITQLKTGKKYKISVFRDGIAASVATDTNDLRKFVGELIPKSPQKYAFLQLLVEDSIATIAMELNRDSKRLAAEEMRETYKDTILSLGGTVTDDTMHWLGLKFYVPQQIEIELLNGKIIYGQELAEGIPLKQLREIDLQEFKRVSDIIIQLENGAQKYRGNRSQNRRRLIDKDRMPGQYFYNLETKTIAILDQGQAKEIDETVHKNFERFIARIFLGNIEGAIDLYAKLVGLEVSAHEREELSLSVMSVERGQRPFHLLNQLSQLGVLNLKASDPVRLRFMDLVHAVRAKMRLAHWAASIDSTVIADDIKSMAWKEISPQFLIGQASSKISSLKTRVLTWLEISKPQEELPDPPQEDGVAKAKTKADIEGDRHAKIDAEIDDDGDDDSHEDILAGIDEDSDEDMQRMDRPFGFDPHDRLYSSRRIEKRMTCSQRIMSYRASDYLR